MNLDNVIAKSKNKVIVRDGDRVYKIFNADFSKADILNEALNQARVEETGIKMNRILEVTTLEDGRWVIVSEFIEGKTLAQLMKEHPEKEDEYLEKFVDLQVSIHGKRAIHLNKIRDKMNMKMDQADIDPTIRYELHTRLAGMKKHVKVLHGDFNPTNVIMNDKGELYVLDWAHATQGNASADAARTYLLFCLSGREDLAKKYMKLFCIKSDIAKQLVQQWLPIVAASQSVKGNPEEREFLLSWVDVVDYE